MRPVNIISDPGDSSNVRLTLLFFLNLTILVSPSLSMHVVGLGPSRSSIWE